MSTNYVSDHSRTVLFVTSSQYHVLNRMLSEMYKRDDMIRAISRKHMMGLGAGDAENLASIWYHLRAEGAVTLASDRAVLVLPTAAFNSLNRFLYELHDDVQRVKEINAEFPLYLGAGDAEVISTIWSTIHNLSTTKVDHG